MYLEIDKLNSTTGWTTDGTITASFVNAIPEYCANNETTSLVIDVPITQTGKYIRKTLGTPVDVSDYQELVFHIWSRNKKQSGIMLVSDYAYKLTLNATNVYYIPILSNNLNEIVIDVSDVTTITKIEFTALTDDADSLIVSSMGVYKEEMPLDLFKAVQDELERQYEAFLTAGEIPTIGTLTCTAGATYITFPTDTYQYIDRYALIRVAGATTEHHHVIETDEKKFYFSDMYDGTTMLASHVAKPVYLRIPAIYGAWQSESIIPCFSIWGITPQKVYRGTEYDNVFDTLKSSGIMMKRREGMLLKYTMMIDCEARTYEIIALMSKMIRNMLATEWLWINGRQYEIKFIGIPTEIEPTMPQEILPKMQYQFEIEFREENFNRESLVPITTTTVTPVIEG